jgi:hypothetical protein
MKKRNVIERLEVKQSRDTFKKSTPGHQMIKAS